jgi:hypothetical protein
VNPSSRRLPHVVTRADLARLLTPTYADALSVDEDEAHERLTRALERSELVADLYEGLWLALESARGPRTTEDAQLDRLSKGIQARRRLVKPAPASPAISALLVRLNVELGIAPEQMRATLATDKGRALLHSGLRQLGAHLVKELIRG